MVVPAPRLIGIGVVAVPVLLYSVTNAVFIVPDSLIEAFTSTLPDTLLRFAGMIVDMFGKLLFISSWLRLSICWFPAKSVAFTVML